MLPTHLPILIQMRTQEVLYIQTGCPREADSLSNMRIQSVDQYTPGRFGHYRRRRISAKAPSPNSESVAGSGMAPTEYMFRPPASVASFC